MKHINRLVVSFNFGTEEMLVGELVIENQKLYFQYYDSFQKSKLEISPFKLPNKEGIFSADTQIFGGLFGVFNDSLPDGWGRLLMDRYLSSKNISIANISPLDRLAMIGKNGRGALQYKPVFIDDNQIVDSLDLDYIALESNNILIGKSDEVIQEIFQLGGSSGGARPKIHVGYNSKTNEIIYGKNIIPEGFEHFIIKFSSTQDPSDIAEIELAYSKMALKAGIKMSPCQIFTGKSGKKYFGTKRFDRDKNTKLHLHSAAGLMHDNFRLSNMDYGHVMDAAYRLEESVKAYEKVLRLAAFNVFSNNRDDHSKNISFLMDKNGIWTLAPAYDLTFSYSAHGHHSMMIAGESLNPDIKHLNKLAAAFGISKPEIIFDQIIDAVKHWEIIATECGVSKSSIKRIQKALKV